MRKNTIPPAYVACPAGKTLFGYSYSVPSPQGLFKNSSTGLRIAGCQAVVTLNFVNSISGHEHVVNFKFTAAPVLILLVPRWKFIVGTNYSIIFIIIHKIATSGERRYTLLLPSLKKRRKKCNTVLPVLQFTYTTVCALRYNLHFERPKFENLSMLF